MELHSYSFVLAAVSLIPLDFYMANLYQSMVEQELFESSYSQVHELLQICSVPLEKPLPYSSYHVEATQKSEGDILLAYYSLI